MSKIYTFFFILLIFIVNGCSSTVKIFPNEKKPINGIITVKEGENIIYKVTKGKQWNEKVWVNSKDGWRVIRKRSDDFGGRFLTYDNLDTDLLHLTLSYNVYKKGVVIEQGTRIFNLNKTANIELVGFKLKVVGLTRKNIKFKSLNIEGK